MLRLFRSFALSALAFGLISSFTFESANAATTIPGLLVSDTDADSVKLFDVYASDPSQTYKGIFTKNSAGTAPDAGLIRPFGMTFGPDGNLYVASLGTAQIRVYNGTTGNFIRVAASNIGYVNSLAFGPDNNLYYSSYRETINGSDSGAVMKLNMTTGATSVFAAGNGLLGPTGIAFDPRSGDLFVASSKTASSLSGSILRFNGITGAFKSVYVSTLTGGLVAPAQINFGPVNPFDPNTTPDLFVTSFFGSNSNAVTRFDGNGAFASIAASGSGILNPGGAVVGDDNLLYVTGYGSKAIYRFIPSSGINIDGNRAYISSDAINNLTGPTYVLQLPGGSFNVTSVPEPSSVILSGLGIVGLVAVGYRNRKARLAA